MSKEEKELLCAIATFLLQRFPDPVFGGTFNGSTERLEKARDDLQWSDE